MKILTLTIMMTAFFLLAFTLPAGAFTCSVNATGLNFDGYDVFSAIPKDATATITVTCQAPEKNPNTPLPVIISLSPGNSGSIAQRLLQGPVDQLAYNLFTNPSCSTIWGDGSGSSQTQTNFITKITPLNATLYGRIPAQQNVSAGSYSDNITVTIDW